MCVSDLLHVYTHRRPWFIISSEGCLWNLHRIWHWRNLGVAAVSSIHTSHQSRYWPCWWCLTCGFQEKCLCSAPLTLLMPCCPKQGFLCKQWEIVVILATWQWSNSQLILCFMPQFWLALIQWFVRLMHFQWHHFGVWIKCFEGLL